MLPGGGAPAKQSQVPVTYQISAKTSFLIITAHEVYLLRFDPMHGEEGAIRCERVPAASKAKGGPETIFVSQCAFTAQLLCQQSRPSFVARADNHASDYSPHVAVQGEDAVTSAATIWAIACAKIPKPNQTVQLPAAAAAAQD